ncbi:MAG: DUF3078 domain-containing protein [Ignavibacteriales bacterium]|nr:DUF3078 domain-containing protein [Ignavibacteriales bacterium]
MKTLAAILALSSLALHAQGDFEIPGAAPLEDDIPDSLMNRWIPTFIVSAGASQIAFSDWIKGGENSITWTTALDLGAGYKTKSFRTNHRLKASYGQTKIGSDDFQTNDNELYIESIYSPRTGMFVEPYASANLRTQITDGYKYTEDSKERIASFFDPGYLMQSAGFIYEKLPHVTTRVGFAAQEIFTNRFRQYSDDPETPDETEAFRFDTGLESVTEVEIEFMENMIYKKKLSLFTRFESLDIWDVRWDNTVNMKVNDYFNAQFTYLLVYRHEEIQKPQIKQTLQLGVSISIL